jgi:hypothetical protein
MLTDKINQNNEIIHRNNEMMNQINKDIRALQLQFIQLNVSPDTNQIMGQIRDFIIYNDKKIRSNDKKIKQNDSITSQFQEIENRGNPYNYNHTMQNIININNEKIHKNNCIISTNNELINKLILKIKN